jgi:hypothetical protein
MAYLSIMRWQGINAVVILLTFLVSGSGWVLHRHYCPVSQEQVISLLQQSGCNTERAEQAASCCPMEQPQQEVAQAASCCTAPVATAVQTGQDERDCCRDEIILLELRDPYTAQSGLELAAPLLLPAAAPVALTPCSMEQRQHAAATPDLPPPYRRSLDRLNALQVYRT